MQTRRPQTKFFTILLICTILSLTVGLTISTTPARAASLLPDPANSAPKSILPEELEDVVKAALGPEYRPMQFSTNEQAKLLASDKASNDQFGYTAELSPDGLTAVVGAWQKSDSPTTQNGAAYIFVRSGNSWSQQTKLTASDKANNDYFGESVSLSSDGNIALIGAYNKSDSPNTGNGAVYVFTRSGSVWSQQTKLLASDRANNDGFGLAVALSSDGGTALISAWQKSDSPTSSNGAAYIFTRSGSVWSQQAKLLAADRASNDQFGIWASISGDGNTALIGAYNKADSPTTGNGAAYVFTRSGSVWSQQAKLLASDRANNDQFGFSVVISSDGNTALIGAINKSDSPTTSNGAAYVFTRSGSV